MLLVKEGNGLNKGDLPSEENPSLLTPMLEELSGFKFYN